MKVLNITKNKNKYYAKIKSKYSIPVDNRLKDLLINDIIFDAQENTTYNGHKYYINGSILKTIEGNKIYFVIQDDSNFPCLLLYGGNNRWILSDSVSLQYDNIVENYGYIEK